MFGHGVLGAVGLRAQARPAGVCYAEDMKLVLAAWVAAFCLGTARAAEPAVELACGQADAVADYIRATMGRHSQSSFPLKKVHEETGRRFYIYDDSQWVLTAEFFSRADPAYDVSCIVDKGDKNNMEGIIERSYELPTKTLGDKPLPVEPQGPIRRVDFKLDLPALVLLLP